jgi:hypothetical protein
MSEKLNKDDNSSKVINKEENDETEKNLNINNSLINSKCLLKELEEKWDKIEKNNSLNSLSLSEKKQSKNNSISSFKNIGITIKDIIKTKYKKNYEDIYYKDDNNFNDFITHKKEELQKYKTNKSNNHILMNNFNKELNLKKNNNINYIQPKLLFSEEKIKLFSPVSYKLKSSIKKGNNKSALSDDEFNSICIFGKNPSFKEISKKINNKLAELKYRSQFNKVNKKQNNLLSIKPIKIPNYKNELKELPFSIMPSSSIEEKPLKKFIYSKNKDLNSIYKIIMN